MTADGNPLPLLVGSGIICACLWMLLRRRIPGGFEISRHRGTYVGRAFDRQDPRTGLVVVVGWMLCGLLLAALSLWALLGG